MSPSDKRKMVRGIGIRDFYGFKPCGELGTPEWQIIVRPGGGDGVMP